MFGLFHDFLTLSDTAMEIENDRYSAETNPHHNLPLTVLRHRGSFPNLHDMFPGYRDESDRVADGLPEVDPQIAPKFLTEETRAALEMGMDYKPWIPERLYISAGGVVNPVIAAQTGCLLNEDHVTIIADASDIPFGQLYLYPNLF